MLARIFARLTGGNGRERRFALAASLAFHVIVIGALIWLFVPSGDAPEAIVTIEVTIVGSEGTERPADTDTTQKPPAVRGATNMHKPPPPAAQESRPQTAPSAIAVPPPSPVSSDAVLPAAPAPTPPSPPSSAAPATNSAAAPSPSNGTGQFGGASATASGAGDAASTGQQGSGEGDHPPRYKLGSGSTPYPPYPMVARRNGYQGRVVVRLEVAADGRATGAEVLQSSGYDVLDQSAVDTLKDWKLEPALSGGKAVPGSVNVPVRFRLSG